MSEDAERLTAALQKLTEAEMAWREAGGGRKYYVGNLVLFDGALATVVHVNQGSEDPEASTVDIRFHDGDVLEGVKVASKQLVRYRS